MEESERARLEKEVRLKSEIGMRRRIRVEEEERERVRCDYIRRGRSNRRANVVSSQRVRTLHRDIY